MKPPGPLQQLQAPREPGETLSLRAWLAAFSLLLCLAIIAVFAIDIVRARAIAVTVARRAAENLAQSLSQQASDTFEAVDAALLNLSERYAIDGSGPAARLRLRDSMATVVSKMPRLHGLTIVDARGNFVVSNISATSDYIAVSDRPFFRYHRTHPGSSVYISGPARSKSDNVWVIFVTRRLDRADGSFAGVAIARIALNYFEQTYASVDIGRAGSISLFADDATLMARRPRMSLGRRFPTAELFANYKYEMAGTYVHSSSVDGVKRLYAFRRLGLYPLVIDVALAESEYLADWRTDAWEMSFAVASVIAMILALAAGLSVQIGHRKRAEDTLVRLALLDGLTGLANRRYFDSVLERAWRFAARDRTALSLLMIDVDNFKAYNDAHGHQRGDDVLVAIARTIAASVVRPADVAARYGGEEFAVVLPATSARSAVHVAERIRRSVEALGVQHSATPSGLMSISIGVASIVPVETGAFAALIDAADTALYDAKHAGRNRTFLAHAGDVAEPAANRAGGAAR